MKAAGLYRMEECFFACEDIDHPPACLPRIRSSMFSSTVRKERVAETKDIDKFRKSLPFPKKSPVTWHV